MKKISYRYIILSLLSFLPFLFAINVFAAEATLGLSGNNSVYNGKEITINLYVSNINDTDGGIESLECNLVFDNEYLEYISGEGISVPYYFQINTGLNYKIAGLDTSMNKGITKKTNIFTFKFKAKKIGSTKITLSNIKLTDASKRINTSVVSKTISITNSPSTNTNLSDLSISSGSLNFDKNKTNYTVLVDENTANITINATPEDSKASVSGTGLKSLKIGDNKFNVTVKAPSGASRVYSINVNRKDNRSSNNNLSSLKVSGADLSPAFNKNTLEYSVKVPYSTNSLKIDAKKEDSKAKIDITNNDLISEKTVNVKVIVTAENGVSKTYTIHATRDKDPNKKLSNNNYLENLTVSNGTLSPVFNKEQEKYIVYLPYEIDTIAINATVEDSNYAKVSEKGNQKLSVGNNLFTFTVTAEDNSTKTYTVTVVRGINLLENNLSSNTLLKNIEVSDGKLKQKFDKNVHYYTYTGGKISATPEDENSIVKILENDNVTSIIVESQTGDIGIYSLYKEKTNILSNVIWLIVIIISIFTGYMIGKKNTLKRL